MIKLACLYKYGILTELEKKSRFVFIFISFYSFGLSAIPKLFRVKNESPIVIFSELQTGACRAS